MPEKSELITIDINEELSPIVEKYINLYDKQDVIKTWLAMQQN